MRTEKDILEELSACQVEIEKAKENRAFYNQQIKECQERMGKIILEYRDQKNLKSLADDKENLFKEQMQEELYEIEQVGTKDENQSDFSQEKGQ